MRNLVRWKKSRIFIANNTIVFINLIVGHSPWGSLLGFARWCSNCHSRGQRPPEHALMWGQWPLEEYSRPQKIPPRAPSEGRKLKRAKQKKNYFYIFFFHIFVTTIAIHKTGIKSTLFNVKIPVKIQHKICFQCHESCFLNTSWSNLFFIEAYREFDAIFLDFRKNAKTVPMECSGARGTLIHEKNPEVENLVSDSLYHF